MNKRSHKRVCTDATAVHCWNEEPRMALRRHSVGRRLRRLHARGRGCVCSISFSAIISGEWPMSLIEKEWTRSSVDIEEMPSTGPDYEMRFSVPRPGLT